VFWGGALGGGGGGRGGDWAIPVLIAGWLMVALAAVTLARGQSGALRGRNV
jgi:hypothetical protein